MDLTKLRSTRTRIAKFEHTGRVSARASRTPPPPAPAPSSRVEIAKEDDESTESTCTRDWTIHMEGGLYGRMRVIFVGHNPSAASWGRCAPYAHGSNRFWKLMSESGLVPASASESLASPERHVDYPRLLGYGFGDLLVVSGSVASDVKNKVNPGEVSMRIRRNAGHCPRVLALVSKTVAEKLCLGWKGNREDYGMIGFGRQWALTGLEDAEVWVLPSSSGRAGLKWESRIKPFVELKEHVQQWPWPEVAGGGDNTPSATLSGHEDGKEDGESTGQGPMRQ